MIAGSTILILGGAGLVGQAIARRLLAAGAGHLVIGALTRAEAETALDEIRVPGNPATLTAVGGDLFARAAEHGQRGTEFSQRLADDLLDLSDHMFAQSHLAQLILGTSSQAEGVRPSIVIDAVNTATALAYGGTYRRLARVMALRAAGDEAGLLGELDGLLGSFALPRLVRHVQILSKALVEDETTAYIKIGTTGTGGMGLNIPYTHGEERPSRVLLTKSAIGGAHSMLLALLARTPGAPMVKEIKPAAAITWKRIAYGPILKGGRELPLYDCPPEAPVELRPGDRFSLAAAGRPVDGRLESVFIDTGENGLFSIGEFSTITSLGQMEAVTPEEIAELVARELAGRSTGRDFVAAIGAAVMGPSYRAGALRAHALAEARALAAEYSADSIAFELLGPPRLSKLLFEAELLRRAFGTSEAVAAADPSAIAAAMLRQVIDSPAVRRAAISVGIPILMPDGQALLCAQRGTGQHRWETEAWTVSPATVDRWAETEWIDLRPTNAGVWRERAAAMANEARVEAGDKHRSSGLDRRYTTELDIGAAAAYVFDHEDGGARAGRGL